MKKQLLSDAYRFKGFVPEHYVQSIVTDAGGRVIRLKRRQKKRYVLHVAKAASRITITAHGSFVTYPAAIYEYILKSKCAACIVAGAMQ